MRVESGRVEHRMAANLAGHLESTEVPLSSQAVMITDISSHGFTGDFRLDSEVIYCLRQGEDAYVIGLKFARPTGEH